MYRCLRGLSNKKAIPARRYSTSYIFFLSCFLRFLSPSALFIINRSLYRLTEKPLVVGDLESIVNSYESVLKKRRKVLFVPLVITLLGVVAYGIVGYLVLFS